MKKYKLTLVGKSEEWIETDEMELVDGVFRFSQGGQLIRAVYADKLEGPPIEIEKDDGSAWDEELRKSDLPYAQD